MNEILNALAEGNHVSEADLERLGADLVEQWQRAICLREIHVVEATFDRSGAFPGLYYKLRSDGEPAPLDCEWIATLSLGGYDLKGGAIGINACVHVLPFIDKQRVFTESGSLLRFSLKESSGAWTWVNEGWIHDENDEFSQYTRPE